MGLGRKPDGISEQVDEAILASTSNKVEKGISIDVASAKHPTQGGNYLPAGTVMTKLDGTEEYKHYEDGASDGSEDESTAVVLKHDVDLDEWTDEGAAPATAYLEATVKADKVVVDSNFDWSKQQNLTRFPQS